MPDNLLPTEFSNGQAPGGELAPYASRLGVPGGFPGEQEEGSINWGRYLSALNRYRWLLLLVTLAGTGAGVVATRFLRPQYTTTTTIWIEPHGEQNGPIRGQELLNGGSWVDLVRTAAVLDSTTLRLGLFLTPEDPKDTPVFSGFALLPKFSPGQYVLSVNRAGTAYALQTKAGLQIEAGLPGDSIGRAIGFRWAPTPEQLGADRKIRFMVQTPRDASTALGAALTTDISKEGNFLRITLKGSNAQRITATVNAVAEQFVAVAADLKQRKLTILAATLKEQVEYSNEQLRRAENALETFKVKTITLPSEVPYVAGLQMTQAPALQMFFNQKVQLEQLKQSRKSMEDILAKVVAGGMGVDAFQQVPAVHEAPDLNRALTELSTAEAELRALLFRYTPEHKPVRDVQERIRVLRQETIPTYATALIEQLKTQESTIESQISSSSKDLAEIPVRTITEERLNREKTAAQNLFLTLQDRYEETKLALASAIPDVKVLDPAVTPTRPDSNRAPQIILFSVVGSLAAAIGLALLLDLLDKRFRYPEQVTKELGLSILGAVPAISGTMVKNFKDEEAAQVVEAFRTIRLNLAHSYGTAGPVLLTVSSPGPGDGKSFVSSNLALSFAEAGSRTLLIDGDIRRGELHRMFGIERRPGLVDYLSGSERLDEIIRPSVHSGLSVIACGARRHQAPELLGSSAMAKLMGEIKARYNVIIVDSPPLGAGIDPFVLGTATGHIMLVLRSGETDRLLAEAKLKLLDRLPVRLLGAVLNDVQTKAGAYRYYSYTYGYAAEEEPATPRLGERAGGVVS